MRANSVNISKSLNITPDDIVTEAQPVSAIIQTNDDNTKADSDYEYARRNLYNLIDQGQEALEDMIEFARQAQHPRAYEVVSGFIANLVDANQKLLHLSKQIKEIKKQESDGVELYKEKTINNNLYVGSTAEMLKMIKGE